MGRDRTASQDADRTDRFTIHPGVRSITGSRDPDASAAMGQDTDLGAGMVQRAVCTGQSKKSSVAASIFIEVGFVIVLAAGLVMLVFALTKVNL
jgi:hypothetical protein